MRGTWGLIIGCCASRLAGAAEPDDARISPEAGLTNSLPASAAQVWNWHFQNTDVVQYHPGFSASYSGPNSLRPASDVRETVSVDLYGGLRLWRGAEAHADALVWQGRGFADTRGVEAFPNGEAFRLGSDIPNINLARIFLRQDFALDAEAENAPDTALQLRGARPESRLTLTLGKLSAKDIFDPNAYANDPRTQFMSWALMANEAWDYPADAIGYQTGMAVELNLPKWAFRWGWFQVPRNSNGTAQDSHYLDAWAMVAEIERRFTIGEHPGAARFLGYLNRAQMGSFAAAVDEVSRPADIQATRAYRVKFGFGLNLEQEIAHGVGTFLRLGWNDGRTESWMFADVDRTVTLGTSLNGEIWGRPQDTFGLAGGVNGLSASHRDFFAAGGTGILAGDGTLSYGWEQFLETYYNLHLFSSVHLTFDYQFVAHPAFNRDRGPVSILSGRLHLEF